VNPGIWAQFVCVYHCPLLHTRGIYPHIPQNTSFDTTSNDELGQKADKIALPFVEAVYWGLLIYYSHLDGASLKTCDLCHA
jgi:hypothetical protein